jgi:hypothetical protein
VPRFDQPICQVRAEKAGTAGNKNAFSQRRVVQSSGR